MRIRNTRTNIGKYSNVRRRWLPGEGEEEEEEGEEEGGWKKRHPSDPTCFSQSIDWKYSNPFLT